MQKSPRKKPVIIENLCQTFWPWNRVESSHWKLSSKFYSEVLAQIWFLHHYLEYNLVTEVQVLLLRNQGLNPRGLESLVDVHKLDSSYL